MGGWCAKAQNISSSIFSTSVILIVDLCLIKKAASKNLWSSSEICLSAHKIKWRLSAPRCPVTWTFFLLSLLALFVQIRWKTRSEILQFYWEFHKMTFICYFDFIWNIFCFYALKRSLSYKEKCVQKKPDILCGAYIVKIIKLYIIWWIKKSNLYMFLKIRLNLKGFSGIIRIARSQSNLFATFSNNPCE